MTTTESTLKIKANNIAISYTEAGPAEAPAIIFIHGFPLNKSMWNKQIDALKDQYRVIAFDVRGHGESEAGDDHFSINLFVSDLISFMENLAIKKAILCGLSMGGYIALYAAQKHPDLFNALILSDTSCAADTTEAKHRRIMAIEDIKINGLKNFANNSITNLFAPGSLISKSQEISLVRDMIMNTSSQSIYNTMHALAIRMETCSRLHEIKIPVLILVGIDDIITPLSSAKVMHENSHDWIKSPTEDDIVINLAYSI
jgi:3-oxoadipate enol-lactonase